VTIGVRNGTDWIDRITGFKIVSCSYIAHYGDETDLFQKEVRNDAVASAQSVWDLAYLESTTS
jgi:hypothetical protein